MVNARASVDISHPVALVWDYVVDPDHASNVLPGMLATRADKRPPYAPGDRWHGTARFLGITYDWTGVFTHVDTHRVMEFRSIESRFPFATVDSFEAIPDGTRYTAQAEGEPAIGGPVGRILDVLVSKVYQRVLAKHLANLPAHIDAWVEQSG